MIVSTHTQERQIDVVTRASTHIIARTDSRCAIIAQQHKQASSVHDQIKLRIAISISKLHSCIAIVASTSTAFGKEIDPSAPHARTPTPFLCCVADGGNNETGNAMLSRCPRHWQHQMLCLLAICVSDPAAACRRQ
jgi:hypothetical protein